MSHRSYNALAYSHLFLQGQEDWMMRMSYEREQQSVKITRLQFHSPNLFDRDHEFNYILHAVGLFLKFRAEIQHCARRMGPLRIVSYRDPRRI